MITIRVGVRLTVTVRFKDMVAVTVGEMVGCAKVVQ